MLGIDFCQAFFCAFLDFLSYQCFVKKIYNNTSASYQFYVYENYTSLLQKYKSICTWLRQGVRDGWRFDVYASIAKRVTQNLQRLPIFLTIVLFMPAIMVSKYSDIIRSSDLSESLLQFSETRTWFPYQEGNVRFGMFQLITVLSKSSVIPSICV